MTPANRKFAMFHRKMIRCMRRFSVEHLGGTKLRYTCRTCGHAHVKDQQSQTGNISEDAMKKLAAYQNQGGATAECPHCTKQLRDERFPLK